MSELPQWRSHTGVDFKRCVKKWYWRWCLGLTPKAKTFGALDLGNWVHEAFRRWYIVGRKRKGNLNEHFDVIASHAIIDAETNGAPEQQLEIARDLQFLGHAMMLGYMERYRRDTHIDILAVEEPLEFVVSDQKGPLAIYKLKPDAVFKDTRNGRIWLFEHKTATTIQTNHLIIDDQARPYAAIAEPALKKAGIIRPDEMVHGIMYNFLRKAFPDTRETNAEGHYLNKNGSLSKKQPPPYFMRYPVTVTDRAKAVTLRRKRAEVLLGTTIRQSIIDGKIDPKWLPKTPHKSCPRFCEYFRMCTLEEEGAEITDMQRSLYIRRNPYQYEEESTDEPSSFELG